MTTDDDNPFGDRDLGATFVWKKKEDQSRKKKRPPPSRDEEDRIEEIEKVRRRRDAREAESRGYMSKVHGHLHLFSLEALAFVEGCVLGGAVQNDLVAAGALRSLYEVAHDTAAGALTAL